MPAVRMSDLRWVQFDVRDLHGEVVSIASYQYIIIGLLSTTTVMSAVEDKQQLLSLE